MDYKNKKTEEDNNQKGLLASLVMHTVLAGLMFFMPMTSGHYEHKEANIQVELPKDLLGGAALGLPDQGKGDNPSPGKPDPNAGNSEPSPVPVKPEPITPAPEPVKPVIAKPKPAPTPTPVPRTQTTEDPNAVAIRRQQEEARKKADEEKYRQQQADRTRRQAEEAQVAEANRQRAEADAKAKAEQAAKDKFKGRFGNGTQGGTNGGGGTGTGRGNTGTAGNQGTPDGDPNSTNLNGIGRGPGTVSGFGGRAVRSAPRLQENSQKAGRVVIDLCVDADGNVVSTRFNASKSSTLDDDLQEAAIRNARQYKFAAGGAEKQCGSVTYNFIVK
jgi:outer membrane biosynthesis protein TonB